MAEHNIDNLLKALKEAQAAFAHCQEERAAARQVVAAAKDYARRIRSTLHHLQRERDLRRKPDENAAELEKLINQLQKKQEEEARAKQNLQDAQRTLREVENQAPPAQAGAPPSQSQVTGQEEHEASANEIQEKQREEQRALSQIRDAREVLKEKKQAVRNAAVTVTRTAAEIPLKRAKAVLLNLVTKLQSFGGVSLGYGYAVLLGAVYELIFYRLHGINIFLYSTPSDFLLSGYKLFYIPLLSFVPALLLLFFYWLLVKLACYRIPGYAEIVANIFPHFAQGIPIKNIAFLLFLVLPVATTVVVGGRQFKQGPKDQVSIVAVPPLQQEQAGPFFRLGENSTYLFLKSTQPSDASVLPVQLSRIAYISECEAKGPEASELGFMPEIRKYAEETKNWLFPPAPIRECKDGGIKAAEPDETVSKPGAAVFGYEMLKHVEEIENNLKRLAPRTHEHEHYVTEKPFRSYIAEKIDCVEGSEAQLSDFIRFARDEDRLPSCKENLPNCEENSPRQRIRDFAKSRQGKEAGPWTIFGFASLDGDRGFNEALATRRAKAAEAVLCTVLNCNDLEITIEDQGEDHPINGVANGRSAVIAVCVEKNESAVGQSEDISGKG